MKYVLRKSFTIVACIAASSASAICFGQAEKILPEGVEAVWDIEQAYRLSTPTRDKICINGLWRWQPAGQNADKIPTNGWGYFKVPGCWPGITNHMQKDSQTVHAHPDWAGRDMGGVKSAWYQREITIPAEWRNRRIAVRADYVNSHAAVYVDGRQAGRLHEQGPQLPAGRDC